MSVIRVNKTKDFTVMSNTHLRERNMSLKAKGLLSLMLSLPDDWDYSIEGLEKLSADGESSVRVALKELESFRYLVRTRQKDASGKFTNVRYDVYEKPQVEKPQVEKPQVEKPQVEKPQVENQGQLNTKELNTKEQNIKVIKNSLSKEYEIIYNMYPNKADKESGYKQYIKAINNGATQSQIIQGIKDYAESVRGKQAKYIKKLSTYLYNECWKDIYTTPEDEYNRQMLEKIKNNGIGVVL